MESLDIHILKAMSDRERRELRKKFSDEYKNLDNQRKGWEKKLRDSATDDTIKLSDVNATIVFCNEIKTKMNRIKCDIDLMDNCDRNEEWKRPDSNSVAISIGGAGVFNLRSQSKNMTYPKGAKNYSQIQEALKEKKFKENERKDNERIQKDNERIQQAVEDYIKNNKIA